MKITLARIHDISKKIDWEFSSMWKHNCKGRWKTRQMFNIFWKVPIMRDTELENSFGVCNFNDFLWAEWFNT